MALQGLAEMTLGVPRVDETRAFYEQFGLAETTPGVFATQDGGEQLRIVERPYRQLVEYALSASDNDDVERVRAAASRHRRRGHRRSSTAESRSPSQWSASGPGSLCVSRSNQSRLKAR